MRAHLLAFLRRSLAAARRLDRAEPLLLRPLPAAVKRRLVKRGLRLLAPLLPGTVEVEGVRLAAPRGHLSGYVLTPHEPPTVRLIERHLEPGSVAVDVGANIGYLTLQMARRVGTEGRVYALEPAPDNLIWLVRNVNLNLARQVRVLAVAAGAAPCLRALHLSGSTRHSFYGAASDEPERAPVLHVPQVRLDDVVAGAVDMVKIDVEGAELEVLGGMERILAESPRILLVVEWNPERLEAAGESPVSLPESLRRHGLQVRQLGEGGRLEPFDPAAVPGRGYLNLCAYRDGTQRGP